MEEDWLKKILDDDDLGLINIKQNGSIQSDDQFLINKFIEIADFYKSHQREPEANFSNVSEFILFKRLHTFRNNPEQRALLEKYDENGLLKIQINTEDEPKKSNIISLEDIFNDDDLGIFDNDNSIFNLIHVPKERTNPEHVSRRKRCKEFGKFKSLFEKNQLSLKAGTKKIIRFQSELQIKKGEFFVVDGMLAYVANVGEKEKKNFGNVNARLYLIFENGTESNMFLRSLAAALWKDPTSGQIVESNQPDLIDLHLNITPDDQATGYIYILKSLSENEHIKCIDNLYKIGYSTLTVDKRVANAINEPTFLMAPIEVISIFQCYNMNAQKFEALIHTFFGSACLNVEICDNSGKSYKPREWFIAPLRAIELAIRLMINGEIIYYRYDPNLQEVISRDNLKED